MAEPSITITFEIEPIVKLYCTAVTCKHNLMNSVPSEKQAACELKHLVISYDGKCKRYQPEEK